MSRFQYRTTFDNVVSASSNFDKKMVLSQASLESLRSIIPSNVDLNKNIDLVGAAFNAAVVNKFNKNGDGIDTDTAIAFKDYFILFIIGRISIMTENLLLLLIQKWFFIITLLINL